MIEEDSRNHFMTQEEKTQILTSSFVRNNQVLHQDAHRSARSAILITAILAIIVHVYFLANSEYDFQLSSYVSGIYYTVWNIPTFKQYNNGIHDYYFKQNIKSLFQIAKEDEMIQNHDKKIEITNGSWEDIEEGKFNNQVQWLHYSEPNDLMHAQDFKGSMKKISSLVTQGVTLVWKIKNDFFQNWVSPNRKNNFIAIMGSQGLFYHETLSLNLRSPSGRFVLIFKKTKQSKSPHYSPSKVVGNFLAIHTILRMEENISFLREWIGYHVHLGVDKIYLYHNIDSAGNENSATASQTKFGIDLACFGSRKQSSTVSQFEEVWNDYRDYLIYVPWQPIRSSLWEDFTHGGKRIIMGQEESYNHYHYFYQEETNFTAFIDVDEFLFSPSNENLQQFIMNKFKEDYTLLRVSQRKFLSRFCFDNKLATKNYAYFPAETSQWAPKAIIHNRDLRAGKYVHELRVDSGRIFFVPPDKLRINHYNAIKFTLEFAQKQNWAAEQVKLLSDDSMKRYDGVISDICGDEKCSQGFQFACPRDSQIECLVQGKFYNL